MDQGVLTFTTVALLVAVTMTGQNLLRYLKARDWNGAAGIGLACLLGWGVIALAANAEVTENLRLITDGPPIGDMDFASILLLGIGFGTGASAVVDFRKAIDSSTSAEKPKVLGPPD
jgi:hypothetical protein